MNVARLFVCVFCVAFLAFSLLTANAQGYWDTGNYSYTTNFVTRTPQGNPQAADVTITPQNSPPYTVTASTGQDGALAHGSIKVKRTFIWYGPPGTPPSSMTVQYSATRSGMVNGPALPNKLANTYFRTMHDSGVWNVKSAPPNYHCN
jgi:hypothetical protein